MSCSAKPRHDGGLKDESTHSVCFIQAEEEKASCSQAVSLISVLFGNEAESSVSPH